MRKPDETALMGPDIGYESAVASLSGALTSLAGSHPIAAAVAGLVAYAVPTGLRYILAPGQSPYRNARSFLRQKMLVEFQNHVLSCPLQTKRADDELRTAILEAGLGADRSFCGVELLPESRTWWDGEPLLLGLQQLRAKPIRVSCSCTSPGFLAAFETMRQLWDIPVIVDFHSASSREQLRDIQSGKDDYDFLVVGAFSFLFQTKKLTDYQVLFPGTIDHQYLLSRPIEKRADFHRPSILEVPAYPFDAVYFVPETANEMFVRKLAKQNRLVRKEMSVADIPWVGSNLQEREVVLAWDPNAQILMKQCNLRPIPGQTTPVPICLAAHRRHLSRDFSSCEYVRSFAGAFIAAWNLCSREPVSAFERLAGMDLLSRSFCSGVGLLDAGLKNGNGKHR